MLTYRGRPLFPSELYEPRRHSMKWRYAGPVIFVLSVGAWVLMTSALSCVFGAMMMAVR